MEKFLYFEHKDKIKKTPPGKKTGEMNFIADRKNFLTSIINAV